MSKRRRAGRGRPAKNTDQSPKLRVAEQLLFDAAEEIDGDCILMTSHGGAQAAAEIARRHADATVFCSYLDVFLADSARERWKDLSNLTVNCEADLPEQTADAIGLPLPAGGESELARNQLQTAHARLTEHGRLFASTDNAKDHWLHEQLRTLFGKVTCRQSDKGRLYIASKKKPVHKQKSYECWFAFRDDGRLIEVCSRPGVFSHRRLDLGARALIESLDPSDDARAAPVVSAGCRILDLGCGCGAVGFAAAFREEAVHVHAVDANIRAIECTQAGAERNGLTSLRTQLNADGQPDEPGTYDLVLANPPYFSHFRIGDVFLQAAERALRRGGRTHFVTKQPQQYADRFVELFDDVSVREIRGYYIVKGTRR